jgi:hypothetical protein
VKKLAVAAAVVLIALGYARSRFEKRAPTKDEVAAEKVGRFIATGSMPVDTAGVTAPSTTESSPATEPQPEPETPATNADVSPIKERVAKLMEHWQEGTPEGIDAAAGLWMGGPASQRATAGFNRWRAEKHLFVVESFDVGEASFHPKASGGGYVTVEVTINKLPYRIAATGNGPLFWSY